VPGTGPGHWRHGVRRQFGEPPWIRSTSRQRGASSVRGADRGHARSAAGRWPLQSAPPDLVLPGVKPPSGWLYVLDPNNAAKESEIVLLDPTLGRVMGAFRSGQLPAMALSPDGTRLYVASRQASGGAISVIDTASGGVLQTVAAPNLESYVQPVAPAMAMSPDGHWLYVPKRRILGPGSDEYTLATFDTARSRFLPEEAPLPDCTGALLEPSQLLVRYRCSARIRTISGSCK